MKYDLSIKEDNVKPHLDIENEMQIKKNGLFTFVLRVNSGKIVDLSILENVNARLKYQVTAIVVEKLTISSNGGSGSETNTIWSNNH